MNDTSIANTIKQTIMSGDILLINHNIAAKNKLNRITQIPKIVSIFLISYLLFSESESVLYPAIKNLSLPIKIKIPHNSSGIVTSRTINFSFMIIY